jgi:hypothetical protein
MRLLPLPLFLVLCASLLWAGGAPLAGDQELESVYGPLPVFEFHSGFWVNLHHFLLREARTRDAARDAARDTRDATGKSSGPTLKTSPGALNSLTPAEQNAWEAAISYYRANFTGKDMQVNLDLILLKNQLGDFEDCAELTGKKMRACDAGLPGKVGDILEAAAPVYRAHWWADQDRANRRWVARVAPLVREQGVGLSERLAEVYQAKWPKQKIRVEVCAYANAAGAYTTLDPLHVIISSTDARNQGPDALEVLFHEASHGIAIPVEAAINRECRQRDKPIPRDLWHALILYTTDEVLRPVIQGTTFDKSSGTSDAQQRVKASTVPYVLRENLSQRGWEDYHLKLSLYWQPYLDGKVTFEDAIAHLISAM